MATSKPAPSGKPTQGAPQIVADTSGRESLDQAIQRRVSQRAYEIYEACGGVHGNDQQHWLQAESEVLRHGLEIRESGSWLSINASLPDVAGEDVRIYLEPERVIVHAEKTTRSKDSAARAETVSEHELFLVSDLNAEVDPATASASFKDDKLTLMVKKRYPAAASSAQAGRTGD